MTIITVVTDSISPSPSLTKARFNFTPLQRDLRFNQPGPADFPSPSQNHKYADVSYVFSHTTDYVRSIISSIKLCGAHNFVLVDVKTQEISKGKIPCIPGWHTDTIINPFHDSRPEVHHIFVTGYASLTEFIDQPVTLEVCQNLEDPVMLANFRSQIDRIDPQVTKLNSCQLTTYGRFDFHRGSVGKYPERRLLIRVTESDVVRPRKKF